MVCDKKKKTNILGNMGKAWLIRQQGSRRRELHLGEHCLNISFLSGTLVSFTFLAPPELICVHKHSLPSPTCMKKYTVKSLCQALPRLLCRTNGVMERHRDIHGQAIWDTGAKTHLQNKHCMLLTEPLPAFPLSHS